MRRMIVMAGCAGAAVFLAMQFIRPEIPRPPVTGDLQAPDGIKQTLRNSCYDCHSNETRLAWFDEVVPGYWLVANDVRRGRDKLNFSEMRGLSPAQQRAALYDAVNQIQWGTMPLAPYVLLHRGTSITPAQLSELKSYLNANRSGEAAGASDLAADEAQYKKWQADAADRTVEPVPNGIQFPHDYRVWKAISTTDRFDNQTVRVILGNPTAVKAIAEGHTHPWPDGTSFAKVAWLARDDGNGEVRSGAFRQVEFMMRDAKKYAATKGWGWSRWRGAELTPYGKDAGFTEECVSCHTPMRDNDYVFTMPLASEQLPPDSSKWNVITSSIDRRTSTMSTLYGNDTAVRFARSHSGGDYPAGSELELATWAQREDTHWYGASIPGALKSVEQVHSTAGPEEKRATFLRSLRAAVLP